MHALRFLLITALLLISSLALARPPVMELPLSLAEQVVKQQAQLKVLEEKANALELASAKISIEQDRKSIDWWFAALAIMTTVVAAFGALLPFLLGRKDKELLQAELRNAKDLVASIKANHQVTEDIVKKAQSLTGYTVESSNSAENKLQIDTELETVTANPQQYSDIDQLRARAIKTSREKPRTIAQAKTALALWNAISALDEKDPNAAFNAAYWAQELAEQTIPIGLPAAQALWRSAGEKYDLALTIKPDMHSAAFNWGAALDDEASEVAKNDLPAAQTLWRSAGEKYDLALRIKADNHDAANNWGIALSNEASEVAKNDLPAAQALWRSAGEKYDLALRIKADKHEAANNWGNALSNEASEVAKNDLPAAQALWRSAGEKYDLALRIKADNHDAANNWGNALSNEASEVAKNDLPAAQALLKQAETLLEKHAQAAPALMAYNLACVYSRLGKLDAALPQLELTRTRNELPDHWRTDEDLAAVRDTPEYQAWLAKHFPNG